VTLWALDGVAPVVHPVRYTTAGHPTVIGAGALVPEGTVVPPDSRALGVPAGVRDGAGTAEFVRDDVALHVENARRYRDGLARVG
jgi:carbonic anhydrase/acetyltransferase-like protein (isoleucine patch superfamily)